MESNVLFSLGYHNKILEAMWLKQRKFISHSSGGWEVQDQDAGSLWNWQMAAFSLYLHNAEREGKMGRKGE